MTGATITDIRIAAAHDGEAELIVTLTYGNGGRSLVTLDDHAAQTLMTSRGADSPADLIGAGWEHVRDALVASSGRYAEP